MEIVAQNALKATVQIAVKERAAVVTSAEGVSANDTMEDQPGNRKLRITNAVRVDVARIARTALAMMERMGDKTLLAKKQAAAPTLLKGEPSTSPRRKLPLEAIPKSDMVRTIEEDLKPFFKEIWL